jgi:hypothetical protein
MDVTRNAQGDEKCVQNVVGRSHLRDLEVRGRITLKLILKKHSVRIITGLKWHRIG